MCDWLPATGVSMRTLRRAIPRCEWFALIGEFKAAALCLLLLPLATTGCASRVSNTVAPILLFNGTVTSPNDVRAVETILRDCDLEYSTVDSRQLNGMSESALMTHRLLIFPGGNYIKMGDSLTPSTTANIRNAVQGGMNYLGICAGGILAG